jgi:hypothetical protein
MATTHSLGSLETPRPLREVSFSCSGDDDQEKKLSPSGKPPSAMADWYPGK